MKLGIKYIFPTKTTVGVIGERMHRYTPADLDFQNERSRYGTWLVVSQEVSAMDSIHFGWAHAFQSPGNPGQHNDTMITLADGTFFGGPTQNQADMLTAAWKHKFSDNLTLVHERGSDLQRTRRALRSRRRWAGSYHRLPRRQCRIGRLQCRPAVLDGHDDRWSFHRPAVEVLTASAGIVPAAR